MVRWLRLPGALSLAVMSVVPHCTSTAVQPSLADFGWGRQHKLTEDFTLLDSGESIVRRTAISYLGMDRVELHTTNERHETLLVQRIALGSEPGTIEENILEDGKIRYASERYDGQHRRVERVTRGEAGKELFVTRTEYLPNGSIQNTYKGEKLIQTWLNEKTHHGNRDTNWWYGPDHYGVHVAEQRSDGSTFEMDLVSGQQSIEETRRLNRQCVESICYELHFAEGDADNVGKIYLHVREYDRDQRFIRNAWYQANAQKPEVGLVDITRIALEIMREGKLTSEQKWSYL